MSKFFILSGDESTISSPKQQVLQKPEQSSSNKEEIHENMNCFLTEVRGFPQFIASTLAPYLESKVNNFQGGQVSQCLYFWKQLTSDRTILQTVSGEFIDFMGDPPKHHIFLTAFLKVTQNCLTKSIKKCVKGMLTYSWRIYITNIHCL